LFSSSSLLPRLENMRLELKRSLKLFFQRI
jgi:hypothetical protein